MAKLYVVMNLARWETTSVSLTIGERVKALLIGRIDLGSTIDNFGESIGWVPVFPSRLSATEFAVDRAQGALVLEASTPDLT